MRMLLTSNGIANDIIRDALVDLLGKPLADSRVVVMIDAMLGFPGDSSTLVEHLEDLRSLGWAEFDVASLFTGPPTLVESRLRSADVILGTEAAICGRHTPGRRPAWRRCSRSCWTRKCTSGGAPAR